MLNEVGVAVVGCGGIADAHFEAIASLGHVRLVATIDVDEDRARDAASKRGAERWYTSVAPALEDDAIDGYILCLPHHVHADVALPILAAKRHVLVEKPMALTLSEAQSMVDCAAQNGVILMSGQVLRHRPLYQRAKQRIAAGEIGTPVHSIRRRLIWHKSIATPWATDPEKAGGWMLYGFGAHEVDIALWLIEQEAETVFALGLKNNPIWSDYDECTIVMALREGRMATVELSLNARPSAWESLIIGSEGSMYLRENSITVGDEVEEVPFSDGFVAQMEAFAHAIATGEPPDASGADVLKRCILPLEGAKRSLATGAKVHFEGEQLWTAS